MLVQLVRPNPIQTFQELLESTINVLEEIPRKRKTVILGPITSTDPVVTKKNLTMLSLHAKNISERGWVVLDIASYQETLDILIQKLHIQGYPHEILQQFSLPLIKTGIFKKLFFRDCYKKSFGASLEHDLAIEMSIPIEYLP